MRNRIQTIETIRKVTDAMRIISMSSHSRLKNKQEALSNYLQTLVTLLTKVQQATPSWHNERLMPSADNDTNPLLILIGSQKGLCGSFNTFLWKFFEKYMSEESSKNYTYICIGKKSIDYLNAQYTDKIIKTFSLTKSDAFLTIATEITTLIMNAPVAYTSVTIFSNSFKSFFIQKPTISHLIPFNPKKIVSFLESPIEGYLWDEEPHTILDKLAIHYIEAQLQHIIFQSLLSEHAARFISMDNSTRNANSLLETTKLTYNKLRQTKITTEITELSGSF
jgi:F-type H+-transporting ATPase subunit gamma